MRARKDNAVAVMAAVGRPPEGQPLANAKHEAVAIAFIADPAKTGWKAYRSVYPRSSQHAAETAFGRLLKNAEFAGRIVELQRQASDGAVMTAREVLEQLSNLGRANMADFMKPGPNGEPILDFSNLTRDQSAALVEVTQETYVDGRSDRREVKRTRFKLGDKKGALELLARHHNLLIERHQHDHSHSHTLIGALLKEIDQEARAGRVIEHSAPLGDQEPAPHVTNEDSSPAEEPPRRRLRRLSR